MMKINFTDNSSVSFRAKPVGLARKIITKTLTDVLEKGTEADKTFAYNLLYNISGVGKYFHSGKPIIISAEKSATNISFYTSCDKNKPLFTFMKDLLNEPLKFLETINKHLIELPNFREIKAIDAKFEADNFMLRCFGKQ